jgi:hypothetical protein
LKKFRNIMLCFVVVVFIVFVCNYAGLPTATSSWLAFMISTVLWFYLENNRPVTSVPPAERDLLLAQAPPAGYGLVYVHRPMKIGGQAIGFDVDLDTVTVTQLKAARFTRLVVAPGSHTLKAGPKKSFGQIAQAAKGETGFAISAGETIVFRLDLKRARMQASIDIIREEDVAAAMIKFASLRMVAPDKPADSTSLPVASSVNA